MLPAKSLPPKTVARIAGILYVLMFGAGFNELYVRPRLIKSGDPTGTADNIRASATLFRIGFFGDLMTGVIWMLTAMTLYLLLRHVNQLAAAAMVVFAAVGGTMQCLTQLNQITALTIASGDEFTRSFGRVGSAGLTMLFVDMQNNGYVIASVFFGLWLAPLGYLAVKSAYFPNALGVLLIVACCGYLLDVVTVFLAPGISTPVTLFITYPAAAAGELTLMLWLLIKGVRTPEPDTAAPAMAATVG
jgi:hypothetical protein